MENYIPDSSINNNPTPKDKKFPINFQNRLTKIILVALVGVCLVYGIVKLYDFVQNLKLEDARKGVYENTKIGDYKAVKDAAKEGLTIKKDDSYLLKGYIDASSIEGNLNGKELENFNEVMPFINVAATSYAHDFHILLSIGYAYETAGKYNEALEFYNKAIAINPTSSEAYFHRGHVLQFLGKIGEANADYDTSYSLDNSYSMVLIAMGNRYFAENDLQTSFEMFKKASQSPNITNHTKSEALTAASIARTEQMLYMKEAIDLAKEAAELTPNYSPALAQYAYVSFINGDAETASVFINKAIEVNPKISKNYNLLAQMLRYNKLYSEALINHREAVDRVENDNTLVGSSQKDGAIAIYYYDTAKTYDMSGIKTDMITLLEYALYKNPNLKDTLKIDHVKYNFFESLSKDEKFLKLIN